MTFFKTIYLTVVCAGNIFATCKICNGRYLYYVMFVSQVSFCCDYHTFLPSALSTSTILNLSSKFQSNCELKRTQPSAKSLSALLTHPLINHSTHGSLAISFKPSEVLLALRRCAESRAAKLLFQTFLTLLLKEKASLTNVL